jgi:ABC-type Fe3+-hydroxamate transport system substrate-binding protein
MVQDIAKGLQPPPLVVDLNPWSLQEVLADVARVGDLLRQPAAGVAAAAAMQRRVDAAAAAGAAAAAAGGRRPSVAFLEWAGPLFIGGHWTPQLIEMAGGQHPLNPPK